MSFKAVVWEYEICRGPRADEVRTFETERERDDFIADFNRRNTAVDAPDWHIDKVAEKV